MSLDGIASLELGDLQGIVVRGYGRCPHARLLMRRVESADAFAAWAASVKLSTAAEAAPTAGLNLAISPRVLTALGWPDTAFDEALGCGMASPRGRRVLADDAEDWRWSDGDRGERVDAVVLVYAASGPALEARCDALERELDRARAPKVRSLSARDLDGFEHFGFRDGLAQPRLAGPAADTAVGEIVFGYPDAHGRVVAGPGEVLRNGSVLVVRELAQDVPAFWRAMAAAAGDGADERLRLAAKMVGRWPSGAPVGRHPERDPGPGYENEPLAYADDAEGHRCPIGAHVRRMHPRDWLLGDQPERARAVSARHRIVRRGRPYGAPTGLSAAQMAAAPETIPAGERGLVFACLNTDLERQFEFLQQTWGNNPKFAGLYADPDPITGVGQERCFTEQRAPVRRVARGLPRFIAPRGGGYFVLPGIRSLRALAPRAG